MTTQEDFFIRKTIVAPETAILYAQFSTQDPAQRWGKWQTP